MTILLISLLVVLLLCIIKISLFEDKVKNENRIIKRTGLNSLGQLPYNDRNGNILVENKPRANMMKYIRDIRTNILSDFNGKVLSVISCNPGEGKSFISNNLAISIARLNKSVLLIDANLREKTNLCQTFYIEDGEGLTDFIKEVEIGEKIKNLKKARKYIKPTQVPNLYILQNGTITENCYELLKTKNFKELVNLLRDVYDVIIVDGTSFYENEDCFIISRLSDASILVTEKNRTSYKSIIQLKEQLEDSNCNILGFVLNKTNLINGKYYSKRENLNYGMYIETLEEHNKSIAYDEIEDPITIKLNQKDDKKFDILHKEIKDNIMTEDFINDVEVNFNMKIDNMEKNNEKNINNLLDNIQTLRREIDDEREYNDIRRSKDTKNFDIFTQDISDKFDKMEEQIDLIKKKTKKKGLFFNKKLNNKQKNLMNE